MELLDRIPGPAREVFPAEDDIAAVLLDASNGDLAQAFVERSLSIAEEDGRTVSVALSDPFDGRDGGVAFDGLTALFPYRYLYGPRAFLTAASLPPRPTAAYEYPGDCEDFIVKRILEGNLDEARRKIDETIEAASAYTPATVRAVVARLSSALFSAIERLERAVLFTLPSASTDSLATIVQLDTVSDVKERFALLLAEIETLIAFHQGQRTNVQADRVDVIIADSFADPNLSLELIADRLSFSAGYVGRVYRKLRGKSVADAINDERIAVARARLENTNATIETIAAGVGIANPGSFYRLFKERCGLTPSEYRERTRFPSVDSGPPAAG